MKLQKICVAVKDMSESALEADMVKEIAGDNAQVRLIHVRSQENFGRARFPLEEGEQSKSILDAALLEFQRVGIKAHGKVCSALVGKEAEAIVDEATKWGADAIVLGHPHHGKLSARVRGGLVQRVIQSAPCPVVVAASSASLQAPSLPRERVAQVA
ncbi:MAG TPA: universal stress protein [Acidimicrobiales bacterium]|nr:universal stress protein [Acidimicrobiales bacterium]